MKAFAYAAPRHEDAVLDLLSAQPGETEILAGGTDLIGLMRKMLVTPDRVVNIKEVESLRGISADSGGVTLGAITTLAEMLEDPALDPYPGIKQAINGIASAQLQSQGTLGGELCQRPRCWYFRNGQGLLSTADSAPRNRNQFHAILANSGPAKYVHASRLAPVLIALGAQVRVIGPAPADEAIYPLVELFRVPRRATEREHVLAPNQLLTHILLPPVGPMAPAGQTGNATYEVRQGAGPDYPLASAAAVIERHQDRVVRATVVLGHVAPIPWVAAEAAEALLGKVVTPETALEAGCAAVARATPLSDNGYKVQLARVAVQRAVLLAAGLETGGF